MKTLFSLIFYTLPLFVSAQVNKQEIDDSIKEIENYWKMKFSQKELTFIPPSVYYYNKENPITTACGTSNAFYCGGSLSIAISKDLLEVVQNKYDFKVIRYIIAHEYGHSVQHQLQKSSILSIDKELQADCLSGTFLFNIEKNKVTAEPTININTLWNLLSDFSEGNQGLKILTDPQAHGDAQSRMRAFKTGYEIGSVNRCLKDYNIQQQSLNLIESIFDIFKKNK
ncbi:neutral zinc metallopeptidase [Arcicella lustrica]|uniref:Neutral zinc metallopeptidase n=1 Tax=Arcicella lustrica TaxID=2984196 RepID=A0ABU5SDS9_9BACT|nr:neutral zinc metallopeptidase [Arcicella sp. DC25W]MEA5425449.1 neutral zinc metallopeptidase [Arcicella sp. DC25W]